MIEVFAADVAGKILRIESGRLAKQAGGSCTVSYGDTVVLATAVMGGIREGVDFFPLSVDYEERLYAAGKIKGSRWIKREGRPSDEAILTSRLVDRAIRPLFPKGIKNEVQVIVTVLSFDQENDADVVALIAASTALAISPIPWDGPIGGVRVGQVDGAWVLNPSFEARDRSSLDVVVAGKNGKVLMLEAEALEVPEETIYQAIDFSHQHITAVIALIQQAVSKVGKTKVNLSELMAKTAGEETPENIQEVVEKARAWAAQHVPTVLFDAALPTKAARKEALSGLREQLLAYLEQEGIGKERRKYAVPVFEEFVEAQITKAILEDGKRVDGRSLTQIRPLAAEVSVLPRTHGSGLFNRGETQVLSIVTLGAPGDEQYLDGLEEAGRKRFMHHYNFPPFSVGEVKRLVGPGRREIGHGELAEKALRNLVPPKEDFPYTVRIVSEVLGSNGSSSMGSVCGATLALMDAGVPIRKPIAGIAMGMASDEANGRYVVLTDLQDLEDGNGGMDFKIAGSRDGITAIQLDTKTQGLPMEVVRTTLTQALQARLEILDVITKAIAEPRAELSKYAPRIVSFKINPEKIREVIGSGGKTINEIIDATGVQIDIDQDGLVMITSTSKEGSDAAVQWVQDITKELQAGEVYEGTVTRIMDFGAIVEFLRGRDGMVHISEISYERVGRVEDVLKIGDKVKVKVIAVEEGRTSLSMKALLPRPEGYTDRGPADHRPQRGGAGGRGRFPHRGR